MALGGFVILAVFGGLAAVCVIANELAKNPLSDGADCFGDVPAIPDDLKVSHAQLRTETEA